MIENSRVSEGLRAAPLLLVGALIVASVWWDGAFDLRYWAPLTLLALALLIALTAASGLSLPARGPLAVSLVAIWVLAAFALLSAAWSESAADAWQGGALSVFYAALFTLAVTVPASRRWRLALGAGLVLGVVATGVATELRLLIGGADAFLAGRLNDPIGYRNGTAAFFALAAWPLIGIAARRGLAFGVRAAALAAAVLVLGLAFLTQSRGVLLGVVVGGAISLAIGPDRLRRSWLAVAVVAILALGASSLLTPYDASRVGTGVASAGQIRTAAETLLLLCCVAFVLGALAFVFDNGLRSSSSMRTLHRTATLGLAVLAGLAVTIALVKVGSPADFANRKIDEFTSTSAAQGGGTRLGSVSGQRYDLWRVAVDQFADHPLIGAGEGSYRFAYYRDRHTDRNLDDAHSLPLQLLAETGLVGVGLLAVWLGALAVAVWRRVRDAAPDARVWIAGLSAAGGTVVAQSAVDWFWLIPGLFGLGVLMLGLAARDGEEEAVVLGPSTAAWRAATLAALAALTVGVGALFLSNVYLRKARQEAFASPRASLSAARSAASLNPVALPPLYIEASALETLGDRVAARRALRKALDLEPSNFVTLGLLGDLEVRAGHEPLARSYYRRALGFNPRDVGLQKLSEGMAG